MPIKLEILTSEKVYMTINKTLFIYYEFNKIKCKRKLNFWYDIVFHILEVICLFR